jgi:hypothetical protein
MQKFALRVFNRMSHDKEVSGVQVASSLLQLPGRYTPKTELHRINLYYLRRRLLPPKEGMKNTSQFEREQTSLPVHSTTIDGEVLL